MSVGVDNLTPSNSVSSIVDGVSNLVDISNSLSEVEFGASQVLTVFDGQQSFVLSLSGLTSSVSSENSLLVKSHWLRLVVCLILGRLDFLCHSSFL